MSTPDVIATCSVIVAAAIPGQTDVAVAEIEFPGASPEQLKIIEEFAEATGFHITYESMYGESFELHIPSEDEGQHVGRLGHVAARGRPPSR